MSPTELTIAMYRREGYAVEVVERWIPDVPRPDGGKGIRKDFIGVGDLLAFGPGKPFVLIQTSITANMSARIKKAKEEPRLRTWLEAGGRFLVVCWDKRAEKERGLFGKQNAGPERWTPRIEELTLADLATEVGR